MGVIWEGVGDGCRSRNVCEHSGCITSMFQEQECVLHEKVTHVLALLLVGNSYSVSCTKHS